MAYDDDAKRFLEAKKALMRIALSSAPLSLDDIFGSKEKRKSWPREIMKRALRAGVVEMLPKAHLKAAPFYRALPGLDEIVVDEERLSNVIWPEHSLDAEEVEAVEGLEDVEHIEGNQGESEIPEPNLPEPDAAQMLEGLVKLGAAILDNVVHIRQRVEELEKRLIKIEETWR